MVLAGILAFSAAKTRPLAITGYQNSCFTGF